MHRGQRRSALVLAASLALCACGQAGSPTGSSPDASPPPRTVVVGGAWEAPRVVSDAGERPLTSCLVYHTSVPCRPLYRVSYPRLAVSRSGSGLALWHRFDGARFRLASSRFHPDSGWAAPEDLPGDAGVTSDLLYTEQYAVATDAAGNGLAVWLGTGDALYTSRLAASGGWSLPEPVGRGGWAQPGLHATAGGVVLFRQHRDGLFAVRRDGGGWTRPERLASTPGSQPFIDEHRLAMAADGGALAAWVLVNQVVGTVGVGTEWNEVWTARLQPGRGWAEPQRIAHFEGAHVSQLGLAAHASGGVVTYRLVERRTGGPDAWRIWGQQSARPQAGADTWSEPRPLSGQEDAEPRSDEPRLAADASGNAVLTWATEDATPARYTVRARAFATGSAAWGEPALITNAPGYLETIPASVDLRVASSDAGNALTAWKHRDAPGHRSTLWASHFVPGAGWGEPQAIRDTVNDVYFDGLSRPEVAMDERGNGLAVWAQPEGDHVLIASARLVAQSR